MPKTLWTLLTAGLLALGVAGCGAGGGGRDIAADVCKMAETCNALSGITVEQCKKVVNGSLQSKTGAARSDTETALDACLAAGCTNWSACVDGALAGGSGSGGSGGSSVGGSGGSAVEIGRAHV